MDTLKKIALMLLVANVAVLLAMAAGPPSASAKYWTKCGDQHQADGASWFDAKGHGVNCATARRVARKWFGNPTSDPGRWRCESRRIGYESSVLTCKRDRGEVVKFKVGA